ncbi:GTPase Obg [Chlamydiales bacterium STE3]|nr:GTPase Obg [Chlamydiales bacterium STE3]
MGAFSKYMFVDRVKVQLIAGKGGNGVVAWRREKYIPKGGPCGGNGGRGGSIILRSDVQIFSLDEYRNHRILKAENGRSGGPNRQQGRAGKDLIIKIPCGTLVKNIKTGEILHDFTQDGDELILCKGGRGGRGNDSFKTPTNRTPNTCTPGTSGESTEVELELKLIADVGLVGFPNAGKSTLISTLAHIRVKIAAYPFTTLQPNLGFFQLEDRSRIYIADIPGIIEGAHNNRGLGFEFLRHIERTKLLLFVLDSSGIDGRTPLGDYQILRNELGAFNSELLNRPSLILLNKIDQEESLKNIHDFYEALPELKPVTFEVSALAGQGLKELTAAIASQLRMMSS